MDRLGYANLKGVAILPQHPPLLRARAVKVGADVGRGLGSVGAQMQEAGGPGCGRGLEAETTEVEADLEAVELEAQA